MAAMLALSRPARRILARVLSLVLIAGAAGCAAPRPVPDGAPETSIQWPLGPDGSRIVWVKSIAQSKDLEVNPGFWKRVQEFIHGRDNHSIIRPYGVLHDRSQKLYVADPGAGVVHRFDIGAGQYSIIGRSDEAPMRTPIGLTRDDAGRLYVTDPENAAVYRTDADRDSLKPFITEGIGRPTGIAFNPVNKLIYISDTVENQIVAVDLNGVVRYRIGVAPGGKGEQEGIGFNHPTDLCIDRVGQIYVTDSLNFRIVALTPDGQMLRQFGGVGDARGYFSRPKGIAVDSAGHIYVCDALRDAVQVFENDGTPLITFGKAGTDPGRFWMPSGLYIDQNDTVFVADTFNKRIQVFQYVSGHNVPTGYESKLEPSAPAL